MHLPRTIAFAFGQLSELTYTQTASAFGPMISGFLQAGAYSGLNGTYGLAGWRWLFIIDGIITIPIALLGFLIMPGTYKSSWSTPILNAETDLPTNTPPSWIINQRDIDIAQQRMKSVGRSAPARFTKRKIAGFFRTWHLYLLVPCEPASYYRGQRH
jgi:ACS family pantothenate transporter-like MFS transporter